MKKGFNQMIAIVMIAVSSVAFTLAAPQPADLWSGGAYRAFHRN